MNDTKIHDIESEDDIRILVDEFYKQVVEDPLLRPVFVDIANVDWDEHLPKMYAFWGAMLLKSRNYHGQPWPPHAALYEHMTPQHFTNWIRLFNNTVDTHFQGTVADTAKERAAGVAVIFQSKLAMMGAEGFVRDPKA